MIINSLCNTCFQTFTIMVQGDDAHLVKEVADEDGFTSPCPRLCGGRINLLGDPIISEMTSSARLRDPITITATQLYQAVNGMGLPDEVPKTVDVVESLLKANKVKGVSVEDANGRLYLHELQLDNGVTIHLSSGSRGAQVLKITKERTNGPSHHR